VVRRLTHQGGDRQEVTLICAGGDNYREAVGLAQGSVQDYIVEHVPWGVITDEAHESDLVVDDEQNGVVPINPLELVRSNWADAKGSSVKRARASGIVN